MFFKNTHTGEVYEYFLQDVITVKSGKKTTEKKVPHLMFVSGLVDKPKEPFRVTEDFNKFDTFIEIQK